MFIKLADIIVYQIFGLTAETKLGSSLHFFIYDVFKILFLLFSIILIISFLRSYIDNNKFKKYIEKQPKLLAHLLASIFGAVTPFCSCSSIPLFIGFIEAGIPLYADATTIIPIAQVLIQKGAAIGTVLVFMMAVVGLSLPEMIILSRVMKKELIIRYVIFMFITFTIIGYFYNFVLC